MSSGFLRSELVTPVSQARRFVVFEATAVETYRAGALIESQARRLPEFESRFQVQALLKEHDVPLQYTAADLEDDLRARNESSGF